MSQYYRQDKVIRILEDGTQIEEIIATVVYGEQPEGFIQHTPTVSCSSCNSTVVENSRGLGDTIAKITHATGLDKLAELYTKVTGKPCGCASRQEALNKLLPYNIAEEK